MRLINLTYDSMMLRQLTYDCSDDELTPNVLVYTCDEVNRIFADGLQENPCAPNTWTAIRSQYALITAMRAQYLYSIQV